MKKRVLITGAAGILEEGGKIMSILVERRDVVASSRSL